MRDLHISIEQLTWGISYAHETLHNLETLEPVKNNYCHFYLMIWQLPNEVLKAAKL